MTASTTLLGLALPITGDLNGQWGDVVNNSITSLLDSAVAGTTTLSSDVDVTLSTTALAANQAREAIILWTAGGTITRVITAPAQSKTYTVINKTSSTQSIKIVGVGPTTGVTIVAGEVAQVAWNGSDFIKVSNTGGSSSATNLVVSGTTTLSGLTASTALALDASKNVMSVANTGTGSNVLSTSPTLTGTTSIATLNLSNALGVAYGGTGLATTPSNGALDIGNGSGFTRTTLTAGTGISVTNTSGGITIANTSPSSGGTVTSVTGTSPISSSGGAAPAISLAAGYGDTLNPYAVKTANYVLAGPTTGASAVPTFRAIVAADIPTLNQNTTGTAGGLSSTLAIASGGSGQTTAQTAMNAFAGAVTAASYLRGNGTNVVMNAIQAADVPTLNQNTTGTAGGLSSTLAVTSGGTGVTSSTGTGSVVLSTSPTLVTPALGTPASGNLTNCSFPTLNQNTSGTAAGLSTTLAIGSGGTGLTAIPSNGQIDIGNGTGFTRTTLTAGSNVTITNAAGSITIAASSSGSGSVTSVGMTVPSFLSVTGSPITSSGTLAVALSGTALPVLNGGTGVTTSTGTGNVVLSNSPSLVSPALGTPSSGALTNCTFPTLNQNTTGTAAGLSSTLAVASGGTGVTSSTGSGSVVLSNSPSLVTPALGTPSSGTLTNCTFPTLNQNTTGTAAGLSSTLAVASGGTGVTTSTGSGSVVLSSSPTLSSPTFTTPALGTPSSGTLTNCTFPTLNQNTTGTAAGLSATLAVASGGTGVTSSTGSGSVVLSTSPSLTTPAISNPTLTGFTETVYAITDVGGASISPANGTIQTWTLGASRTPNAGTFNAGQSLTLMITSGSFTVTWTSIGVTWVGGSAPTLATGTYKNVIVLWKVGSVVYGNYVGAVA